MPRSMPNTRCWAGPGLGADGKLGQVRLRDEMALTTIASNRAAAVRLVEETGFDN